MQPQSTSIERVSTGRGLRYATMRALAEYYWPGDVRERENFIEARGHSLPRFKARPPPRHIG